MWARFTAWLAVTVVEPFREFFARTGMKLGRQRPALPLPLQARRGLPGPHGHRLLQGGRASPTPRSRTYSKLLTAGVTILFSMAGGLLNARIGIIKGLFVGGIAMAASNLMFAWIAMVGPNERLYAATIFVDGFTSAMSTVAFVAFISYFTSHTYTGTQYALLAAVGTLGRTLVSGASGFVVDALGGNWAALLRHHRRSW